MVHGDSLLSRAVAWISNAIISQPAPSECEPFVGFVSIPRSATTNAVRGLFMRRLLPLAFLLAVPSQWLLWSIAWVTTPQPYVFGGLLACSLLGGGWSIVLGCVRSTEY